MRTRTGIGLVGLALLAPAIALGDQLCGELRGYCGNGWCEKSIIPYNCINAPRCTLGQSMKVIADNEQARHQLDHLLMRGEGIRVCAVGVIDRAGDFRVTSAKSVAE